MSEHTTYEKFCRSTFWRDNTASSETDANRIVISANWGATEFDFSYRLPDEKHMATRLKLMLEFAFYHGQEDAKKSIRDALGVVNARP